MAFRKPWRQPRKPFVARVDLGHYKRPDGEEGGGLVFRSGPFEDRRFRSLEAALAWIGDRSGVVHELQWVKVNEHDPNLEV